MTGSTDLALHSPSQAVTQYLSEFQGKVPVGQEDVGSEDIALANIRIDHLSACFVDSLTGEKYEAIDGVLLGLLKQRVMWDPDPEAKEGPMCRSADGKVGTPRNNFPWDALKGLKGTATPGSETMTCATCPMAEWDSHPSNKNPWCTHQYSFPVVIGDGDRVSGLLTFQRSGIAPAKAYISGFVRDQVPFFAYRTIITLDKQRTGSVQYCTPKFARGAAIADINLLRAFEGQYLEVRRIVQGDTTPAATPTTPKQSTGTAGDDPWAKAPEGEVLEGVVEDAPTEFVPAF